MDLRISWTITKKDFSTFRKHKYIIYSLVFVPLLISILLPAVMWYVIQNGKTPRVLIPQLLNAFSFFFVILPGIIPATIGSYSIVGEKVEKSLEPLLATPITDGELLAGKAIAAFLPTLLSTWGGAVIFMTLQDIVTYNQVFDYLYFPNWNVAIVLLLAVPLVCALSVGLNVVISSRTSDVRTAQQLGYALIIPFLAVYILFETGIIAYDQDSLLMLSGICLILVLLVMFLARAVFRREEILTKWK
jgi:ABC-type Na+ efflux pump permease subunit